MSGESGATFVTISLLLCNMAEAHTFLWTFLMNSCTRLLLKCVIRESLKSYFLYYLHNGYVNTARKFYC